MIPQVVVEASYIWQEPQVTKIPDVDYSGTDVPLYYSLMKFLACILDELLEQLKVQLSSSSFTSEDIFLCLTRLSEHHGISVNKVMKLCRLVVTGGKVAPLIYAFVHSNLLLWTLMAVNIK